MSYCLYFVVPCYNDSQSLPLSVPVFLKKLNTYIEKGRISDDSRLLLINDASADNTWDVIMSLKKLYTKISAINLSHNVGEENALLAGMSAAIKKADCVITMDSDLQDDIQAVEEMLHHFELGCDIVYGVRRFRNEDGFFERWSSECFYSLMHFAKTGLIRQHANYRLMSKKAVLKLLNYKALHFYLPCVVSNMDFKSAVVYHDRKQRIAGKTHYSFAKKLRLALHAFFTHWNPSRMFWYAILCFCGAADGFFLSLLLIQWLIKGTGSKAAGSAVVICLCITVILSVFFLIFKFMKKRLRATVKTARFDIQQIVE